MAEVGVAGSLPIAIRLADAPEALAIARGILSRAYATAGYGDDHAVILGKHQAPFIAWVREEIVETAGSPEGLSFERTFPEIVTQLRGDGSHFCELTQFAFDIIAPKPVMAECSLLFSITVRDAPIAQAF